MRTSPQLLRLIIFVASVLLLVRVPRLRGQGFSGECIKSFDTSNGSPCFDCCPQQPFLNNLVDDIADPSPGIMSSYPQYVNCGNTTCNFGDCPSSKVGYVASQDASCCLPSGTSPCRGGECCYWLQCLSNNTCGACYGVGTGCSNSGDCCSGICDPFIGLCADCLNDGEYCTEDDQCCGGTCNGGTCESSSCYGYGSACSADPDCCSYNCVGGYCDS